jgi:hypothetical protein
MKKILLCIAIMFAIKSNAQKAYDLVVYKGAWGNFNITLNYANGYEEATEIIAIHKKTGIRKIYSMNNKKGTYIYLSNSKNKTTFGLQLIDEENDVPQKITVTIFFNGTKEDFSVYKR